MYAPHKASEATQMAYELDAFKHFLRIQGVKKYLEIGARCGDSFDAVMRCLGKDSFGLAIDMPGGQWGQKDSALKLEETKARLAQDGISSDVIFGDSKNPSIIHAAATFGPFDAVLIDGDHSQAGVVADLQNYGGMARIVCFHDIVWQPDGNAEIYVPKLWQKIKDSLKPDDMVREFIAPNSKMGIGCLIKGEK